MPDVGTTVRPGIPCSSAGHHRTRSGEGGRRRFVKFNVTSSGHNFLSHNLQLTS